MTMTTLSLEQATYLPPAEALALLPIEGAHDRDAVLAALLTIWRKIFGREDITADDDFFLLGGHSLKALQLQVHVRMALDYEMDLRALFDAPMLSELADLISEDQSRAASEAAVDLPTAAGNVSFHLRLVGLDAGLWERCANQVVERHESLRATMALVGGAPRLRIAPYQPFALQTHDLTAVSDDEREAEAARLLAEDLAAPFDPNGGPRHRFAFYAMGQTRSIVSITLDSDIAEPKLPRALSREMLALALADPPPSERIFGSLRARSSVATVSEAVRESLVPMRREGHRPPLFLVHGAGGGTMNFLPLMRALDADQPVYGLQSRGYSSDLNPLTHVEAMAAYYIEAMRSVQPHGPYQICGHSFGGVVAYEIGQQLRAQGEAIHLLGVIDTLFQENQAVFLTPAGSGYDRISRQFARRLRELSALPWREKPAYLRGRWQRFSYRMQNIRRARIYQALEADGREIPLALKEIQTASEVAVKRYHPVPYPGPVVLFHAQDNEESMKAVILTTWTRLAAGGLEVVRVPGTHHTLYTEANVQVFAQALEARLLPA